MREKYEVDMNYLGQLEIYVLQGLNSLEQLYDHIFYCHED